MSSTSRPRLPGGFWTVEMREPGSVASLPYRHALAGTTFRLPSGGAATLLAPYPLGAALESPSRLWIAALQLPDTVPAYLERFGFPIRYSYVKQPWPSSMYQTVFATEPGSAEMPSAGRPFTPELVTRLVSSGVQIAPILLHTGVASLEDHEPPYEEFYRVSAETAERVNAARRAGRRIIAVGHDGGSSSRDGYRRAQSDVCRPGLDEPRNHARAARAIGEWPHHRTARAARHPLDDARAGCRRGRSRSIGGATRRRHLPPVPPRTRLRRGAAGRLSLARVRRFTPHHRPRNDLDSTVKGRHAKSF